MVDYVKADDEKPQKRRSWFNFKTFLLIFIGFFFISSLLSALTFSLTDKIAVVPISGVILTEKQSDLFGSSVSSRDIASQLQKLEEDNSIKSVLLDINSPGGSPVATEEISKAIESLKKKKPVYALINDVGASGAFWISVVANKTYASPMSVVGSIGVTSAGLSFEDFIKEYNITYRRQVAGKYKDLGTPYREQSEEEKQIIQNLLDEIHNNFIQHVADSRNMSFEEVEIYATGEIFLGTRAKEIGFIDEFGYYPDVITQLQNRSPSAIIVNYGPKPTLTESLGLSSIFSPKTTSNQLLLK